MCRTWGIQQFKQLKFKLKLVLQLQFVLQFFKQRAHVQFIQQRTPL